MAAEARRLEDFGTLRPAEQTILAGLDDPHTTLLGDGTLPPEGAGADRRVRASFLRWCALGGDEDHRLHETGFRIAGALVESDGAADPFQSDESTPGLNLEGCRLPGDLGLVACRFADPPVLRSARLRNLFLNDSVFPGLEADHLTADGGVFLLRVTAEGTVRLAGAHLGGNLDCVGGRFETPEGDALIADRLTAEGGVSLDSVTAQGTVRLPGARLGGDLDCEGGRFETPEGDALSAEGAEVSGAFFWREGAEARGRLVLTAARFGVIDDDPACWPAAGNLVLDRCDYGAFTGRGISAEARIDWLSRQDPSRFGKDFWPQPWEHCAKVLREMGHAEDARAVLVDKERRQREDRRRRGWRGWRPLRWVRDRILLDETIRYGHRPLRAGYFLAPLFAIGCAAYAEAFAFGAMKPNNAFVLRADEWIECAPGRSRFSQESHEHQLACFLDQPEGESFPEFNALIYTADVLFPLVEIEQQANWVPNEDHPLGAIAKLIMYLSIVLGWALSLLAVAGFSGLVKSD